MRAFLLALLASLAPLTAQSDLARSLRSWHDLFRSSDISVDELARVRGKTHPLYRDILPKHEPAVLTHTDALQMLLERAIADPGVEATRQIIRIASLGLDGEVFPFDNSPHLARAQAIDALGRIRDTSSQHLLMQTAAGDVTVWKREGWSNALAAAAVRGLGEQNSSVFRSTIQRALRSEAAPVRMAAAHALRDRHSPRSLNAVMQALAVETESTIAQLLFDCIDTTFVLNHKAIDTDTARAIVITAIELLGRLDWRVDLAVVQFLERVRSPMSIEPLIGVLERFLKPAGEVEDHKLSGVLRREAHGTLQSLTGALIAVDQPAEWRAFWERERDSFVLPPARDEIRRPRGTRSGFFGIPVVGTRVLFVIDKSGSMDERFRPAEFQGDRLPSRLDTARDELVAAAEALPADAKLNLIWFDSLVRTWKPKLVAATDSNKSSLSTRAHKLHPSGATNIFGALKQALKLRGVSYGTRYGSPVDEIFLLSDGQPTAGEVIDPDRILAIVRETNRFNRVRINTIFMGGVDSEFMKRLAEENGGRYVRL